MYRHMLVQYTSIIVQSTKLLTAPLLMFVLCSISATTQAF